jgi:hypothetical protein
MLHLTKGSTNTIYFTANELCSTTTNTFTFTFKCRSTNKIVTFTVTNTSTTGRYDKAVIVVNTYFADSVEGFHSYTIKTGATVVEQGYMYLHPSSEFEATLYELQNNEYTTP